MEEIITVDGRQFKLSTDRPLTAQEKAQTLAEIRKQTGCGTCGPKVAKMGNDWQYGGQIKNLQTCPPGTKGEGDTVVLNCSPTGGTGPYTVTYYKKVGPAAETTFLAAHTVPEGGPDPSAVGSRTDTIMDVDIAGATGDPAATPALANATIRYRMSITDSCPTGALTCTEYCDVALTCAAPTCNFVVT
jgi:hypothetical protein